MSDCEFSDQFDIDVELASSLLKNNFSMLACIRIGVDAATEQKNKMEMDNLHFLLQSIHGMTHEELKKLIAVEMERNVSLRSSSSSAREV